MEQVNWGILSTGAIARIFTRGVLKSRTGRLAAVASRSADSAEAFGREFKIPNRHASYEALLADDSVDAVYIATPHSFHAEWAIKAAEAGKHILCEKPITLNAAGTEPVLAAAREHGVFLMEAYMYRCHPQIDKVIELIRSGRLGEIRFIHAAFSFNRPATPGDRLYDRALGGGGILDVGGYPVSMARLLAGVALGGESAEPLRLSGEAHIGECGVDERAAATLVFDQGLLAGLSCGINVWQHNQVVVFGSEASLTIESPWQPSPEGGKTRLVIQQRNEKSETLTVPCKDWLYALEADRVARHIGDGEAAWPAMSWDETRNTMKVLDRWREAVGMDYEDE